MAAKVTRRRLATLAAALPVASAPAQQPPAEDDLQIQRQTLQRNRELMAKVALPMLLEPAITFKA